MHSHKLCLLGYGSGIGGADSSSAEGPFVLRQSAYFSMGIARELSIHWGEITQPQEGLSKVKNIEQQCKTLAASVVDLVSSKKQFVVLGGDHSSAIGTWSGASAAVNSEGSLGLIWIDAHLDSHTEETSISGNIHGMPVACLLGCGNSNLINIINEKPKLKPENICLIGVRSFEEGEAAFLKRLNVRVFFMEEVKQRGINAVIKEAIEIATRGTAAFGVSIDIDSIDPIDAPGTGTREPDGIRADDLISALTLFSHVHNLIGVEIAEFDPSKDKNHITEKLIPRLINAVFLGK